VIDPRLSPRSHAPFEGINDLVRNLLSEFRLRCHFLLLKFVVEQQEKVRRYKLTLVVSRAGQPDRIEL
jgi:hypothetical protein